MRAPVHQMREKPVVLPRLRVFEAGLVLGLMWRFGMSRREAEIAAMLAEGVELMAIGGVLGLTENTVRTFTKGLYMHIGVHTQAQVVAVVYKAILEARG